MTTANLQYSLSEQQMDIFIKSLTTLLAGYMIAMLLVIVLITALMVAATWRIFKKAGTAGWKALIPIYCDYTLYKIAWKKKYFFIMLACVFVGDLLINFQDMAREYSPIMVIIGLILLLASVIIEIISFVKLAKAFRKGGGFAVGLILLPIIFFPILGFGSAKYRRRKKRRKKALPPPAA